MSRLLSDIEREMRDRGWYPVRKSKHGIWRHPSGGQITMHSSKVRDTGRNLRNLRLEIRRQELGIGIVKRGN